MNNKIRIILLILILLLHIFLRFYQLEQKAGFNWDQVDNAWAAYNILVKKEYPLVGMEERLNSGIFIGPLYYYYVSIFYFFTNLDPIASPITAGVTSIIGFFILFFVTKKIFNFDIALIAVFINAVNNNVVTNDRGQWPINFLAPLSYLTLYFLYKVLCGRPKYLLPLAISCGLIFQIHFIAVFFPIIILLTLPLFPKNKQTFLYLLISLPLFLLFLVPNYLNNVKQHNSAGISITRFLNSYYHGIHLRRVLQLSHDAFIRFETLLFFRILRPFVFFIYPLFSILYYFRKQKKESILLILLFGLWILIPWLVFSTYKGELSDYYFSSTLDIAIVTIAYLTYRILSIKKILPRILIILFWASSAFLNLNLDLHLSDGNMISLRKEAKKAVNEGKVIKYERGVPEAYFYTFYKRQMDNGKPLD